MRVKIKNLTIGKKYEIEGYGGLGGTQFHFTNKNFVILKDYDYSGKLVWSEKLSKSKLKRYLRSFAVRWVDEIMTFNLTNE